MRYRKSKRWEYYLQMNKININRYVRRGAIGELTVVRKERADG